MPHHYFTTPALKLNDITKIDRNFGGLVSNFNYWPQVRPYEVGAQDIQAQFLPEQIISPMTTSKHLTKSYNSELLR